MARDLKQFQKIKNRGVAGDPLAPKPGEDPVILHGVKRHAPPPPNDEPVLRGEDGRKLTPHERATALAHAIGDAKSDPKRNKHGLVDEPVAEDEPAPDKEAEAEVSGDATVEGDDENPAIQPPPSDAKKAELLEFLASQNVEVKGALTKRKLWELVDAALREA